MRIALLTDGVLHPLAGAAGVAENVHSSAADYRREPIAETQQSTIVRAAYRTHRDRGNIGNIISFSTTRVFDTPEQAETWSHDYESAFPRSGTLVIDPTSRPGWAASINVAGTLTSDGSTPVTIGNCDYDGTLNGKPSFVRTADANSTVQWSGTEWVTYEDVTESYWRSTEDVASPELVTTWVPDSPATGTPVVTATYTGRRYMAAAVVDPPRHQVVGCSVILNYTVRGGEITSTMP